jgi:hypothetical protein
MEILRHCRPASVDIGTAPLFGLCGARREMFHSKKIHPPLVWSYQFDVSIPSPYENRNAIVLHGYGHTRMFFFANPGAG